MHHRPCHSRLPITRPRAGLAPLELVMVFPVLMMMAGLLLFVTNATVWKLRSHGAAREAAFQQIHPRFGEPITAPPEWRRPDVSSSVQPGPNSMRSPPPTWANDPFSGHLLFRGPEWDGIPINASLLDGSQGIVIGQSRSDIKSGLWPMMKIHYRFQREVYLFAGQQWQYEAMGIGHDERRSLRLMSPQSMPAQ